MTALIRGAWPSVLPDDLGELRALVRSLPKIELHAHLTGCIRSSTLVDLLAKEGYSPSKVDRLLIRQPAANLYSSFAPWRQLLGRIRESPDVAYRLLQEAAQDFADDGILYAELRVSPRRAWQAGYLDEFLAALDQARNDASIEVRIILGIARHHFVSTTSSDRQLYFDALLRAAERYRASPIVGFDIWGDELSVPLSEFATDLRAIHDAGYKLTLHAGETGPPSWISEAVNTHRARRVGHALTATRDAQLMKLLSESNVLVETCLTSNVLTSTHSDLSTHPMREFLREGIPVALCADNTSVYGTTLTDEYLLALAYELITLNDLPDLFQFAANGIFADDLSPERISLKLQDQDEILTKAKGLLASILDQRALVIASAKLGS